MLFQDILKDCDFLWFSRMCSFLFAPVHPFFKVSHSNPSHSLACRRALALRSPSVRGDVGEQSDHSNGTKPCGTLHGGLEWRWFDGARPRNARNAKWCGGGCKAERWVLEIGWKMNIINGDWPMMIINHPHSNVYEWCVLLCITIMNYHYYKGIWWRKWW